MTENQIKRAVIIARRMGYMAALALAVGSLLIVDGKWITGGIFIGFAALFFWAGTAKSIIHYCKTEVDH